MKSTLLLLAALLTFQAWGQYPHNSLTKSKPRYIPLAQTKIKSGPHGSLPGARTTTVAFYTEDFGTGSAGLLPTGWKAGTLTGGTWKWTDHASSSAYSLGMMASSTNGNGWMIFDSDSIGAACSCAPAGWLQSPAYNCTGHAHVSLNFQDYYAKLNDSCFVWVSSDSNFSTYTSYPVLANNNLSLNTATPNIENVHVNISSAAGGQPVVYLRFVTWGPTLGAYSWLIDDMTLSDLDSVDAGISKSSFVYFAGAGQGFYSFGSMPSRMADSVYPETFVSNYGFSPLPVMTVNAEINIGLSNLYNNNINIALPYNAFDSLADFRTSSSGGFYSKTIAPYTMSFAISPSGDVVSPNNYDTTYYYITDSSWSENLPNTTPTVASYVYMPGGGGNPAAAYSPATVFKVPPGQTDTLTSVDVAFDLSTKTGQVVGVQIMHNTGTTWVPDGVTYFRALTTSDLSNGSTFVYANFAVDETASGGKIIMTGGRTYAAVVKGLANTDTVTVLQGVNPAPLSLIGYTGLADTSDNAATPTVIFGNGHTPFINETTPYIQLNFRSYDRTAVSELNGDITAGKAYPNPANNSVSIPFTLQQDGVVTARITDITGQVIATQQVNGKAGKQKMTFNTTALPDGIYLYSINCYGVYANGRVVVAH